VLERMRGNGITYDTGFINGLVDAWVNPLMSNHPVGQFAAASPSVLYS